VFSLEKDVGLKSFCSSCIRVDGF